MKAKHLFETLKAYPEAEVVIHDASTDDDLPVGKVEAVGGPIVLHPKGEESE